MAGFGVSDNAGVHGGLGAPAPLQVAHGILVQVTGQNSGHPGSHAPGRELKATLSGHEAGGEKT